MTNARSPKRPKKALSATQKAALKSLRKMMAIRRAKAPPGRRAWKEQGFGYDDHPDVLALLKTIRAKLPLLKATLFAYDSMRGYEDPIYRFYRGSFKVYYLQGDTESIVEDLQALAPTRKLDSAFLRIVKRGTRVGPWVPEHNKRWFQVTRPIVEAFFHARYFLEMAVRYGQELKKPLNLRPSGWAALLGLYGL